MIIIVVCSVLFYFLSHCSRNDDDWVEQVVAKYQYKAISLKNMFFSQLEADNGGLHSMSISGTFYVENNMESQEKDQVSKTW